jgi:hypothetical protein
MAYTILQAHCEVAAPPYQGRLSLVYPLALYQGHAYSFYLYCDKTGDFALELLAEDGKTPMTFAESGRPIASDNPMFGATEFFSIRQFGVNAWAYVRVSAKHGHGNFLLRVDDVTE